MRVGPTNPERAHADEARLEDVEVAGGSRAHALESRGPREQAAQPVQASADREGAGLKWAVLAAEWSEESLKECVAKHGIDR